MPKPTIPPPVLPAPPSSNVLAVFEDLIEELRAFAREYREDGDEPETLRLLERTADLLEEVSFGHIALCLDDLDLEETEAMHRVYKLLTAYTNERAKVLRLRQTHGFRVEGSLSIRPEGFAGFAPERLPRPVFDAIRGALVGMARIYNQLPEWARWPKVWRRCAGFDGSCDNEGELMPCPFASDLHGDETLIPLCEKCAELRAREL